MHWPLAQARVVICGTWNLCRSQLSQGDWTWVWLSGTFGLGKPNKAPWSVLALPLHETQPLPRLRQPPSPWCLLAYGGTPRFEVEEDHLYVLFLFFWFSKVSWVRELDRCSGHHQGASLRQTVTSGSPGMTSRVLNRQKTIEHDTHDWGKSTCSK